MNKVLITGANGNLGSAIVNRFLNNNYQVIAFTSPGKFLTTENKYLHQYELDLMDELSTAEKIGQVLKNHPNLNKVVHTVGGFAMGNLENTNLEDIQEMIKLNFNTAFNVVKPLFSNLIKQNYGRIILIGARPAIEANAGKTTLPYALSKGMLFQFGEILNAEGAGKNVVTTIVTPSIIDTPPNRKAMPEANFDDWVKPQQIAESIYWLCSDQAMAVREPVLRIYHNS